VSAVTGWWGGGSDDPVVATAMAAGASQEEWELGAALGLVRSLAPRVVVEIGCDRGGTLYAWRSCCERVYGITTEDNGYDSGGSGLPLVTHGAVVRIGDSHDPASRDWLLGELAIPATMLAEAVLTRRADGQPVTFRPADVLVLDGDHSPEGVAADLADYGPLVRAGGLILLHDITPGTDPRARVHEIWPGLADTYQTTQIVNRDGGFGWGVIHVRAGDTFP
jgi:cephalosporin hydroxylase